MSVTKFIVILFIFIVCLHYISNGEKSSPIKEIKQNEPPKQIVVNNFINNSIDLQIIYKMESSCGKNKKAFTPNSAGALGHFQFQKPTWDECIKLMKVNWDWETGALDYNKSLQVADFYFNKRIPQMLNSFRLPVTIDTKLAGYCAGVGNVKKAIAKDSNNWINYMSKDAQKYIKDYHSN